VRNPSRLAGLRLGVGLDAFIDWIVMHQILQWHHLLTATGDQPATTIDGLEANTLADGLFYLATWVIVLAATAMTVKAWRDGGWRRRGGSTSGCCTLMHGEFFSRPTSYLDLVALERRTLRALGPRQRHTRALEDQNPLDRAGGRSNSIHRGARV
jgi:hypothetical protein